MSKKNRTVVTEEGWYWWRLTPNDDWEPRYFKFNEQIEKFIIRGIERRPTRDSKEGMIGPSIQPVKADE